MQCKMLAALLPAVASVSARAVSSHPSACRDIKIPITISLPRLDIAISVENDWDATSLAFNLTRRDFTKPTDPLPIEAQTPKPVKSTYTVAASLCGTGKTMLILTHGIIESKLCAPLYISMSLSRDYKTNLYDLATGNQTFPAERNTAWWMLQLPQAIRCSPMTGSASANHPRKFHSHISLMKKPFRC